jgi:hypothetical protein
MKQKFWVDKTKSCNAEDSSIYMASDQCDVYGVTGEIVCLERIRYSRVTSSFF